jgi:F0F1-type ATP synthase delta subunit
LDALLQKAAGPADGVMNTARAFICLLVRHGVVSRAGAVVAACQSLLDKREGRLTADLEAADTPDAAYLEALQASLCRKFNATSAEVRVRKNENLIAGERLFIGGYAYDASLSAELADLGRALRGGA